MKHINPTLRDNHLTWGVNGRGECAVFCRDCRKVFARNLKPYEAKEVTQTTEHECRKIEKHTPRTGLN